MANDTVAKNNGVEILNLRVTWREESRTIKADFYNEEGYPMVGGPEKQIDEPFSVDELISLVRDAVEEHFEFLKSLNAIIKGQQSGKK